MTRRRLPLAAAAIAVVAVVAVVMLQAGRQSTATGVVVDVTSTGLTEVSSFTLREPDGAESEYRVGRLENGAEFPPAHLFEHRATGEPVAVHYRLAGDERVAFRIEDAPGG